MQFVVAVYQPLHYSIVSTVLRLAMRFGPRHVSVIPRHSDVVHGGNMKAV